jgi:hypothetical protein
LDVLSCLRVLVAPWLPRSLWGTGGGCCIGPPAPVVPVRGLHGRPLYFPDFPRPWGSLVWAPSATLMPRKASVDRPRSGGFQDKGTHGSFCLTDGVFWASGACGFRGGDHGRPPCFHGLSPILGFVFTVDPGRRPCHLFARSEGLTGGSCLSPPCWAAGSIRIQLLCHYFIRSRGPHR